MFLEAALNWPFQAELEHEGERENVERTSSCSVSLVCILVRVGPLHLCGGKYA